MRTSLRTIPQPDTFSRQTTSVITLGQVRSGPRTTNEYVDSPRAQPLLPLKTHLASIGGGGSPGFALRVSLHPRGGQGHPRSTLSSPTSPVVVQQPLPKSPPLKKEPVHSLDISRNGDGSQSVNNQANVSVGPSHGDNIICDQCGKCRCAACTEPRPLPSHWCCRNTCELSLGSALDVCTCFCCVKCLFYHCGAEEDNDCYEKPCGCCSTPHCCQRWTVMSLVSLCLPCLCTYWPAKACLSGCTVCYNHCRHKGCQCQSGHEKTPSLLCGGIAGGGQGGNSKHSQTRRLLIESESSST